MELTNPAFTIPLAIGLVFTLAGIIMKKFPPKNINAFYGYRTPASMKSKERWDFAQAHSANELMRFGIILMIISPAGLLLPDDEMNVMIGVISTLIAVIIMIFRTERALRNKFNKNED